MLLLTIFRSSFVGLLFFCQYFSYCSSISLPELIEHEVEKHYKPETLRLITSKSGRESFNWEIVRFYPQLHNKLNKFNRLDLHHTFYTSIVIVWLGYDDKTENIYSDILGEIEECVNRRWDRLVVIGYNSQLEILMKNKIVKELRQKIGVSLDKNEIWVDPIVYAGGKMENVKSISDIVIANPMGSNLRGRHFKVSGCEFPPWTHKIGEKLNGESILEGNFVSMLNTASEKFNFTYEAAYTGWEYGTLHENGTWTGMLANVLYPERGYEFTFWLGNDINYPDFDYPSYLVEAEVFFVVGQPKTEIPWNAFLLPFSKTVWALVVLSFVVLGIVQSIATYLKVGRKWTYNVYDSATFQPMALAMEQGLQDIPKGIRYFSLVWLLACTILGTGYRSTLRTNLMFPTPEIIPLTVEELGERSDYSVVLYVMGQLELSIMRNSQEDHVRKIRPRLSFEYESAEKCLEKALLNYHTVCIAWSPFLEQEIAMTMTLSSRMDPLVRSKNNYKRISNSMAFQKYSIFVDAFFGITGAASDSGLMKRWEVLANLKFKKLGIQKVKNDTEGEVYKHLLALMSQGDNDRTPLTLDNLKIVFVLLPIGFFISALLFALEKCYFAFRIIKLTPVLLDNENNIQGALSSNIKTNQSFSADYLSPIEFNDTDLVHIQLDPK